MKETIYMKHLMKRVLLRSQFVLAVALTFISIASTTASASGSATPINTGNGQTQECPFASKVGLFTATAATQGATNGNSGVYTPAHK
jgi:hypothetical protein